MSQPILLVEDDLSLAQTLAAALEPTAIPVEHCVSAELAIEMVAAKEYAVVVVELVPSSGDGASGGYVVRALRKLPKEKRPAAIMLASGSATLRGIDRTSIASLLFKPLDIPLFVEYVTATYRRRLCAEEPAVAAAAEIPPPR